MEPARSTDWSIDMSKNKKNKHKKSKSKSKSLPVDTIKEDMAGFIRDRIIEGLNDQCSDIESLLERIREGDASPNEIDSALQDVVEEINCIVADAEHINSEFEDVLLVTVGE